MSSFQTADLCSAGATAVVTALAPDHLDWHRGDLKTYYRDKLRLCTLPGVERVIVNGDDVNLQENAVLLGPSPSMVCYDEDAAEKYLPGFSLPGVYNKRNALLALEVIKSIGMAADEESLVKALSTFSPLPHRMEKVAEYGGIQFIDDGLATNALPTAAALSAYADHPVAIILGGSDRGIDYSELIGALRHHGQPLCMLVLSEAGRRIAEKYLAETDETVEQHPDGHFLLRNSGGKRTDICICETLKVALREGFVWAKSLSERKTDRSPVILLSPAAPSFSQYRNYLERSEDFAAQVEAIIAEEERF